MPLPLFIHRPDRPNESICTKCYLTVRVSETSKTLEEAQRAHACGALDLKAVFSQSS